MAESASGKASWQTELNAPRGPCVPPANQAPKLTSCRTAAQTPVPQEVEKFESQANSEAQGRVRGRQRRGARRGRHPAAARQRFTGRLVGKRRPQDPEGDRRLEPRLAAPEPAR